MMNVVWIAQPALPQWWELIAPFYAQALEASAGEMDIEQLRDALEGGHMQAVCGVENDTVCAAWVLSVAHYPNCRAIRIVLGAGEGMDRWAQVLLETLEGICATMGADRIELFGRPGFARKLKALGDHQYTVMVRKVNPDERRQRNSYH